jgi:hypothetical protein
VAGLELPPVTTTHFPDSARPTAAVANPVSLPAERFGAVFYVDQACHPLSGVLMPTLCGASLNRADPASVQTNPDISVLFAGHRALKAA